MTACMVEELQLCYYVVKNLDILIAVNKAEDH